VCVYSFEDGTFCIINHEALKIYEEKEEEELEEDKMGVKFIDFFIKFIYSIL
jgi:hypothetical protein